MDYEKELIKERKRIAKKYSIQQKMTKAKYDGKKFKYLWYKRQFNKLREKLYNKKGDI